MWKRPAPSAAHTMGNQLRHHIPNVMAPYLIMLTAQFGNAILVEASLSFLGLGPLSPRRPGLMLSGGAGCPYAEKGASGWPSSPARHQPGGVRLQLFGDSPCDALDPRLRHRT